MSSSLFADRYAVLVAVLIEARREAGVTQVELARRMGRLQPFVSKVERRERRLDPVEFHDWAKALGADPVELFRQLTLRIGDPAHPGRARG